MIYIFEETQAYPLYIGDVQILYPNATEDNLPIGFAVVQETQAPEREYGKTVYEVAPAKIDGVWTQQWEKREMTEEELNSYESMAQAILDKLAADGKI
jgi:hypothetical protein